MSEHPGACPACGGAALIRSGHACGRQRWRCEGCGRQFTRTTPRGKPAAVKREAVGLYCAGLSLNASGKRLGVSAQTPSATLPPTDMGNLCGAETLNRQCRSLAARTHCKAHLELSPLSCTQL